MRGEREEGKSEEGERKDESIESIDRQRDAEREEGKGEKGGKRKDFSGDQLERRETKGSE